MDKKKIVLFALVAGIFLYVDFTFIFKMQLDGINKAAQNSAGLKNKISALQVNLANMENLKVKAKEGLAGRKALITEKELSSLLEEISLIANKYNVKIISAKPQKEVLDAKAAKQLSVTPFIISTDLSSGYHQLGAFINELEDAPRLMAVSSLEVNGDTVDTLHHKVNLRIRVYVKK